MVDKQSLTTRKQWIFGFFIVTSLTFGSALLDKINDFLINNIFAKSECAQGIIDPREGGFMVALEMGIIPIFALLVFGILNKWSFKQIVSIAWKIFILGATLGVIFGSTYTDGSQSLICGMLH